jgi:hypothetical protein
VRFKDGVRLDPVTPTQVRLLTALDMCARMQGIDLTVTCGREGHPAGDVHTRGEALDVRVIDLSSEKVLASYNYIRQVLGDLFTVLYEVPNTPTTTALRQIAYINAQATAAHFHIQPVKGTTYPPQDTGRIVA